MGPLGWLSAIFRKSPTSSSAVPTPIGSTTSSPSIFSLGDVEKSTTATACTNIIANSIATLPLNLYFRNPKTGARQKAGWHPLYAVLKRRPNYRDTPITFFERLVKHIIQKGNAYVFVSRNSKKEVVALHLLNPSYVTETYSGPDGVTYSYQGADYTDDDGTGASPTARILHIPSILVDDFGRGKALVDLARQAVALGAQFDQAAANSFATGVNSTLMVDASDSVAQMSESDAATYARQISDYVVSNYSGPSNAGKPFVNIFGKGSVTELSNQRSNREAELLESRKWQELEICKVFGVPPFLVNGSYDVKYGNLESAMIAYLNFSLMPWLKHLEQKFGTLLTAFEQQDGAYYFEFDFTSLLRSDEKSRAEFYSKLFSMGAMSPGQISAKENIDPPPEGADAYFVPSNLMPLRQDVLDAYMAGAKLKAQELISGKPAPDAPPQNSAAQ